ncbi:aminotransferase class III, putative [Talaromyces stipitatus ATCC 10500]|uniref:Aminotransferase class III, putative n=1 Tax=Talaromyces stipitatus (strain ATCC 10500 / CBS 375.48 / QM 6759 / NRRL 1006) TaxID=441959 RepID=B8MEI0_TALSN|nr:aminotransferase class III, putative [Talaromyces stipitatus ATCC 10500]EED16607.1 aminotransferase class III, putative [Talaromyces stipitatus ATCC 10500]
MQSEDQVHLLAALDAAKSRYIELNARSKSLHEEAVNVLPGGNTRTILHTDPFPIYMKSGRAYQVTSEEGNTYTDMAGEFTAALYGHSHPTILSAMNDVIQNVGMNIGATTTQERLFAREICKRFQLDRMRLTNSGTEANLHALAAARKFTGKKKVVTFSGGYHGGVLMFSGGKPAPNNVDIDEWIVVKYNDLDAAKEAIQSPGVAAVLVEGMQGSNGCICGTSEFLHGIQRAASDAGVLFILDEVMTSRISDGGLARLQGLKPDLKTFGKYLGGGLAFGAFGGRADIMAGFDPRLIGSISHSGTFNNNTLVTHVGYIGLTTVFTPETAKAFTEAGNTFREQLNEVTNDTRIYFTGIGTLLTAHFLAKGPRHIECADDVEEIPELKTLFWLEMLEAGFWVTLRGFIAIILEMPQSELERFVQAVQSFISRHRDLVVLDL